jgi:hypothetical protein
MEERPAFRSGAWVREQCVHGVQPSTAQRRPRHRVELFVRELRGLHVGEHLAVIAEQTANDAIPDLGRRAVGARPHTRYNRAMNTRSRESVAQEWAQLTTTLRESVARGDVDGALAQFEALVDSYRLANADVTHALDECTQPLAPLGADARRAIDALAARIDAFDAVAATHTRHKPLPLWGKARSAEERAGWQAIAHRIALGAVLSASTEGTEELSAALDRHFLPLETAFNGGDRDWLVIRFLASLAKVGGFFKRMPDERASQLVAAWRAFHPRNTKGVNLYMKALFSGRPSIYGAKAVASTRARAS